MRHYHCYNLTFILLLLSKFCISSEFEYDEAIKEIFEEFQPQAQLSTTPRTVRIRISRRPPRRIHRFLKNTSSRNKNSDSITFPQVKPSVKSIRIYQCADFKMRCEFRPNYNVVYPLHCKMEENYWCLCYFWVWIIILKLNLLETFFRISSNKPILFVWWFVFQVFQSSLVCI